MKPDPQGLKPESLSTRDGTAEAVPFQNSTRDGTTKSRPSRSTSNAALGRPLFHVLQAARVYLRG